MWKYDGNLFIEHKLLDKNLQQTFFRIESLLGIERHANIVGV